MFLVPKLFHFNSWKKTNKALVFQVFQMIQVLSHPAKFHPAILTPLWYNLKQSHCCTPVSIYLLKVNNINIETRCERCSKLTIKTSERHHWRLSGIFIVNSKHISHLLLFIVNFEHVIAGWVIRFSNPLKTRAH